MISILSRTIFSARFNRRWHLIVSRKWPLVFVRVRPYADWKIKSADVIGTRWLFSWTSTFNETGEPVR